MIILPDQNPIRLQTTSGHKPALGSPLMALMDVSRAGGMSSTATNTSSFVEFLEDLSQSPPITLERDLSATEEPVEPDINQPENIDAGGHVRELDNQLSTLKQGTSAVQQADATSNAFSAASPARLAQHETPLSQPVLSDLKAAEVQFQTLEKSTVPKMMQDVMAVSAAKAEGATQFPSPGDLNQLPLTPSKMQALEAHLAMQQSATKAPSRQTEQLTAHQGPLEKALPQTTAQTETSKITHQGEPATVPIASLYEQLSKSQEIPNRRLISEPHMFQIPAVDNMTYPTLTRNAVADSRVIPNLPTAMLLQQIAQPESMEAGERLADISEQKSTHIGPQHAPQNLQSTHAISDARTNLPSGNAHKISEALITLRDTGGQIDVALSPDDMGRLTIKVEQTAQGPLFTFAAERTETQDVIRRHFEQIQHQLRTMGLENAAFAFEGQHQNKNNGADARDHQSPIMASDTEQIIEIRAQFQSSSLDIRI